MKTRFYPNIRTLALETKRYIIHFTLSTEIDYFNDGGENKCYVWFMIGPTVAYLNNIKAFQIIIARMQIIWGKKMY